MTDIGPQFVTALAGKDGDALKELFADEVAFLGLTPRRFWEAASPAQVVEVLFSWIEPKDVVEAVEQVKSGLAVDRERVDYTLRIRNDDGLFIAEQRAYFDLDDDGRISRMNAMCGGFRQIAG